MSTKMSKYAHIPVNYSCDVTLILTKPKMIKSKGIKEGSSDNTSVHRYMKIEPETPDQQKYLDSLMKMYDNCSNTHR